jgi:hypothetical protein
VLILRSLVIGALVLASCGTLNEETRGGALGAAKQTATPAPTAGHPSGSAAAGFVRVVDEGGGWSVDIPSTWFDKSPAFALSSPGREVRSFDPRGMDASGNIPPGGEVLVRFELQTNSERLSLEAFADSRVWTATCAACRKILERTEITLGGEPAKFFSVYQNQPVPFAELEPNLYWLVRSPFFTDRVLVIRAVPAVSPRRSEVEQIVSTLQFFRPAPPNLTPQRTRQHVNDLMRANGWTITRIEAKLMVWSEWENAYNEVLRATSAVSGGPSALRSGGNPDTLVWVVAITGSGFTPMKGGPPGAGSAAATVATPTPWGWRISVLPAREPLDWGGPTVGGPGAAWPAWFDALADRDP